MPVHPFVYPYMHPDGYKDHRDWFICPACWQRFDIDRGGISSEYPPKKCPNAECGAEWGSPIYLAKVPNSMLTTLSKKTEPKGAKDVKQS